MSYIANQYNYATPLSSAAGLTTSNSVVDAKYFTLFDNVLDGSYVPISGDVGVWSASLSDDSGVLSTPFVITVTEDIQLNAFRLRGSTRSYPVAFTVQFYNDGTLLYTITETANSSVEYTHYLSSMLDVTEYVITITKISEANSVARLYSSYGPNDLKRSDTLSISNTVKTVAYELVTLKKTDSVKVRTVEPISAVKNTISVATDKASISSIEESVPTNIHTVMKGLTRRTYGKVYVTYTDPLLDTEISIETGATAYNSDGAQISDGISDNDGNMYFTLYDNDLSGRYVLSDNTSQVGWVSKELSNASGYFVGDVYIKLNFSARPIVNLPIYFDTVHGGVPENFNVIFTKEDGSTITKEITGNTSAIVNVVDTAIPDVVEIFIRIIKISKPNHPIIILEVPIISTVQYVGYSDVSNLINIDLLEELTYDDEIEALGGMSANKVTVTFDNSNKEFYFNNPDSLVARRLHRNRKIVPWLGAEIVPGEIEWYRLGTFWSHKWNVPVGSLTASVTAFDTIGLLDTTTFSDHQALVDKSLGYLIEYVLTDAKKLFDFLEWRISDELYDEIIPYAWFARSSHSAALRKISQAYPMHIYCDRDGRVCASAQKLNLDFYYDTWSDDTNVVDVSYDSLNTALPNIINVKVISPVILSNEELVKDSLKFNISDMSVRQLNFNKPYISDIAVTVTKDSSVQYTYKVFSWGVEIYFTGTGNVTEIVCTGTALDVTNSSLITSQDEDSIRLNGTITRNIESDFIQTVSLANYITNRLKSLSADDKYDAEVNYRGDISLTINDPVLLLNGIAPDNKYNIKRHQLTWDGSLTGSAYLNT